MGQGWFAVLGRALKRLFGTPAAASPLPPGFVYLRDVEPSIVQDIRYAGPDNFVGRRIDGYDAPECILTRETALALKAVQAELSRQDLSLKVFDCYRPARAVADFARWAADAADQHTKADYYPALDKAKLFDLGLIATQSDHSRGGAVDLAIVRRPKPGAPVGDDLDFGTPFDFFDASSATECPSIGAEARRNRARLVEVMERAGFRNFAQEWWHFSHPSADGKPLLDFPVRPRKP